MLGGWYGLVSIGDQATTGVINSAEASILEYPLALPIVKEDTYVDDVKSGCDLRDDVTTSIEHVQKALEKGGFMDKFILRNGDKPPEIASADGAYRSASLVHWWFSESDQYGLKLDPFNPNRKIRGSRKPVTIVAHYREDVDKIMHVFPCTRTWCPELFPNFPVCLILCVSGSH